MSYNGQLLRSLNPHLIANAISSSIHKWQRFSTYISRQFNTYIVFILRRHLCKILLNLHTNSQRYWTLWMTYSGSVYCTFVYKMQGTINLYTSSRHKKQIFILTHLHQMYWLQYTRYLNNKNKIWCDRYKCVVSFKC